MPMPPTPPSAPKASAMETVQEEKAALRRRMRQARDDMGEAEREHAAAAILRNLLSLPIFQQARGVHCYLSLPGEVDTAGIFAACVEQGKETYIPFVDRSSPSTQRLGWARWQPGDPLVTGPLGVAEPVPAARETGTPPGNIDLVLAPGLAFDRRGGRLGYGKGYYDEFLARLLDRTDTGKKPVLAGLAYALQIAASIPISTRDIPMNWIVHESGWMEIPPISRPGIEEPFLPIGI